MKNDSLLSIYHFSLIGILIVATVIVAWSFISVIISSNNIGSVCMSNLCVENFKEMFSGTIYLFSSGLKLTALYAAIFGSVLAIKNYLAGIKSAALSGHINHLRLFQSYVEEEAEKVGLDYVKSINAFFWYREMFPRSKDGNVEVSEKYIDVIKTLRSEIDRSNRALSAPSVDEKYTFTNGDHQRRIIHALLKVGVTLSRKEPKIFFDVESRAFRLLDSVNLTFSRSHDVKNVMPLVNIKRVYL